MGPPGSPGEDAEDLFVLTPSALSGRNTVDPFTQYLLLAGRAGTANDAIISTDSDGTINGSNTTGKDLILRANTATAGLYEAGVVRVMAFTEIFGNAALSQTAAGGIFRLIDWSSIVTVDSGDKLGQYLGFDFEPTFIYDLGTAGSEVIASFRSAPLFKTSGTDDGALSGFEAKPITNPQIAGATVAHLWGYYSHPGVLATGGNNVVVTELVAYQAWGIGADITNPGGSVDECIGFNMTLPGGTGPTKIVGLKVPVLGSITTKLSVESVSPAVQMRHAGPGVFGADAAPTNTTSIALEVQSTTKTFLHGRQTDTQMRAMAQINGMEVWNTTIPGSWLSDGTVWRPAAWDRAARERREWWFQKRDDIGNNVTSIVGDVAGAVTAEGTATDFTDTTGSYNDYASLPVTNSDAGWITAAFTKTRTDQNPIIVIALKTGSPITVQRTWAGLFSADPMAQDTHTAPALDIAAFRYSPAADGTAFWRTVTDNASGTPTVTTTTIAIAADTRYVLKIIATTAAVYFFINDVLAATHSATLPTSTVSLGIVAETRTLENVAKNIRLAKLMVDHI